MYTAHHACWDAKNRYGLPEEVPFDYASIAHVIGGDTAVFAAHRSQPAESRLALAQDAADTVTKPAESAAKTAENVSKSTDPAPDPELPPPNVLIDSDPDQVPKALIDLMREYRVIEWDVQRVCEQRGYVPAGTPLDQYDKANPGIIEGLLIPKWDQVYQMIQKTKGQEEIPFN